MERMFLFQLLSIQAFVASGRGYASVGVWSAAGHNSGVTLAAFLSRSSSAHFPLG